ncbi:MAG: hypothetical protein Q8Q33_05390 [Chlamydiota bacterium]|nr:hypothetical protein [Chlamydiota bacterium]
MLNHLVALLLILAFTFTGCSKPSFPKDQVIQSVKDMCKKEYQLDVDVKITGSTLATYVQLENIFDRESGLGTEATQHIGDILLSVSRVSLSTDAPLTFYTVIAADKNLPGVEAVFTRYVEDLRRFLLSNISREDFFQRLTIDVRFSPHVAARRLVLQFFSDLSTKEVYQVLTRYVRRTTKTTDFSLAFLKMMLEMKLKQNIHFKIQQMLIKPIEDEKALVYCKAKETYDPKENYSAKDYSYESGFEHEYLFVIGANNFLPEIDEIIPLLYMDTKGNVKDRGFPEEYQMYQNLDEWSDNDFLALHITVPQFIAKQIAQRIIRKINEKKIDKREKGNWDFVVESVKGHYALEEKSSKFYFNFKIKSVDNDMIIPDSLEKLSQEVAKDVLEKYRFDDFEEIQLSVAASKNIKTIPKNLVR